MCAQMGSVMAADRTGLANDAPAPVLITGGSAGIGLALAHEFAARGHAIAMVARDAGRLEAAAHQLRSAHNADVATLALDLGREDAEQQLTAFGAECATPFGYLVNNAAMYIGGPIAEAGVADVLKVVQTNVGGVHAALKAVLPGMRQRGSGRILNVGSLAGFAPTPGFAVYGASKAFVNVITLALREELAGSGISVSLLAPGPVRTDFIARHSKSALTRTLIGLSTPPDVVAACAYRGLMSGERVIVPGLSARAMWFGMRVLPVSANGWIMGQVARAVAAIEAPVRP